MASSNSPLQTLVLLALLATSMHVSYVASDAGNVELIDKLCGVTATPGACTSCVKGGSQPPGPNWTNVDVLDVTMKCADTAINKLFNDINDVINDGSAAQALKDLMINTCKPIIMTTIRDGHDPIAQGIDEGSFAFAKEQMDSLIFARLDQFNSAINNTSGVTTPQLIKDAANLVEQSYRITQQILASLT